VKREHQIIVLSTCLGLLFVVMDAALDTLFFYDDSFMDVLIFATNRHEMFMRRLIFVAIVVFGSIMSRYFVRTRQAEEKVREKEELYRLHFENVKDVVYSIGRDFQITSITPSVEAQLGYRPDEIIGRRIDELDLMPREYAEKVFADYTRVLEGKQSEPTECEFIAKDGTRIFVEISSAPLFKDGEIVGVVDVGRNITDRKRTEEALREGEARYRTLVENAPDAIMMMDSETGHFIDFNKKALDLFGLKPEELLSVGPVEVSPATQPDGRSSADKAKEIMEKIAESGKLTFEWTHINSAGEEIPCENHIASFHSAGGIMTHGAVRDIRERKRAEEERNKLEARLRQGEKMEAIGALAGGIAHDFNNLLMVIQGNISLMLNAIDVSHPHYEGLSNIETQVISGSNLTGQLLGFAREGRYEVALIELNRIIVKTAQTFGRTRKEITIHQDLANDLSAVEADRNQIMQVLLNIFVNAADAMPNGGDLYVKTVNTTDKDMDGKTYNPKPGRYVLLTFADTGAGMDKDTLDRVFEPFFTTKELGRGTGLGLASAYGIIKGHGGYIDVESEKGRGTTFRIYLPASDRKAPKIEEAGEQVREGKGAVLVVDDELMILKVGGKMLEALGYSVLKAGGGREALDIYEMNRDKIDLVVLDMIMPDMHGGEVYEKLKSIDPDVKVLLSSGYSIDGRARKILDRGCDGFIQKPFDLRRLSEKIEEILTGGKTDG